VWPCYVLIKLKAIRTKEIKAKGAAAVLKLVALVIVKPLNLN
jgi:hypothetical protein